MNDADKLALADRVIAAAEASGVDPEDWLGRAIMRLSPGMQPKGLRRRRLLS